MVVILLSRLRVDLLSCTVFRVKKNSFKMSPLSKGPVGIEKTSSSIEVSTGLFHCER